MSNKRDKNILLFSLMIYLLLLVWIIVFKCKFHIGFIGYRSSVNFIPFQNNNVVVNGIHETVINLMLFLPLGMYLKILFKNHFIKEMGLIVLTSVILETLQYILQMGISDITDVIMNSIGGLIGIVMITFIYKICSYQFEIAKIDQVLGYLSYIGLLLVIIFIIMI